MACKLCAEPFISAFEEGVGYCLSCIPKIVNEREELKLSSVKLSTEQDNLRVKVNELEEEARTLRLKIAFRETLDVAEQKGKKAGELGLGPEQNPYEDKEAHAFWEYGRYVATGDAALERAQAVMLWTIDCLDYVKQISGAEASAKIDTITAKLAPFLERFVEKGKG